MAKINEITGCYTSTPCCTKCEWFSWPLLIARNGFMIPPRTVCPDCGSAVAETVGQYQIRETKGRFSGRKTEYIGFIRKEIEPDVPTPAGALAD